MTAPSKMVLRISILLITLLGLYNSAFAVHINLTTSAVATASVCPSATNVTIYEFQLAGAGAVGTQSVTGVSFTQSGSGVVPGDIVDYKLWEGAVGTGTLLATSATANFTGFTLPFTNVTPSINFFITTDIATTPTTGRTVTVAAMATGNITSGGFVTSSGPLVTGGTQTIIGNPTAITGTPTVCSAATTRLSDGAIGGTWSTSSTTIATVSATGLVTGGTQGTASITFSNGCGVATSITVSVNATPVAIAGNTSLCSGGLTTQLSDNGSPSGIWSSSIVSTASVGAAGLVTSGTAANVGTTTISYSDGCGGPASVTFSVNATPVAIVGNTSLCSGGLTTQLSDNGSPSGTWSSSNASAASVGAAGLVTSGTAANAGTTLISYSDGCGGPASVTFSVNATPVAIVGNTSLCSGGSTTQLSDNGSPSGVWSGGTPGTATVGATTGLVTSGGTQGTTTISYSDGCGAIQSTTITVTGTPNAISGNTTVCSGLTTQLSDGSSGGTWSSGTTTVATIDINTGLVTGGAIGGTAGITYSTGCGTQTTTVTVTATPGAITGNTSICSGLTTNLSDAVAGGVWSSLNSAVATISNTGLVTGGAVGTAQINYTGGCGLVSTTITVGAPNAGSISGPSGVCIGSPVTLSDGVAGGAWSASNTNATVSAGVVTGFTAGTDVINYSVTNSCGTATATYTVTISNASVGAGTIVGPTNMCAGSFTILTDAVSGGVWSAGNPDATVTATGLLTAITPGTDVISYTISNACGTSVATLTVTIGAFLDAGTISGLSSVCPGNTIVLSDYISGGVWSSTNTSVATISGVGVVSGVSAGSTTISYLIISGCGSVATTYNVTVNPSPAPGVIAGPSVICSGTFAVLTDSSPGGVWSTSNTNIATITNAAIVSGASVGSVTVLYSVTNICGTLAATFPMTISLPPNAGSISGPSSVCVGNNISLTDAAPGGVWSSSNTNATVSASGVVTGVTAGAGIISYISTTACGSLSTTAAITINPLPIAGSISGVSSVCAGSSVALTDAAIGGVWSSNTTSVASVNATGNVSGVVSGVALISYSVTNLCGTVAATLPVTVNPLPVVAAITGASSVCVGSSVTLSDATPGGLWSSSNTNISIVSGASGLVVTGVSAGTAVVSYALTNLSGCTVTQTITETINALPVVAAISGTGFGCVGVTTALSDATPGGKWGSSNTAIATIDPVSGLQTGVANGTVTVSYRVTNLSGCTTIATLTETIQTTPLPSITTGNTTICNGAATTLSNPVSGGVWSSTNSVATISATGNVTGLAAGTDYIIYTVANACGTVLDSALVTVNPTPVINPISATNTTICVGMSTTLSESATGGAWSSSNTAVATVSAAGVVSAVSTGIAAISYKATNSSGCTGESTILISVGPALPVAAIMPGGSATLCHANPIALTASTSGGTLTYQWAIGSTPIPGATDSVYIANMAGTYSVVINNGTCSETLAGTVVVVAPNPVIGFTPPDVLYTGSFTTYQWFLNGMPLVGDTSSVLNETSGGLYTVVVTDGNGCSDTSAVYSIATTGVNSVSATQNIRIYPNPATTVLHIDAPAQVNTSVLSVDGKVVITQKDATGIDVRDLANGMYIIMIYDQNNNFIKSAKFAKTQQ